MYDVLNATLFIGIFEFCNGCQKLRRKKISKFLRCTPLRKSQY